MGVDNERMSGEKREEKGREVEKGEKRRERSEREKM